MGFYRAIFSPTHLSVHPANPRALRHLSLRLSALTLFSACSQSPELLFLDITYFPIRIFNTSVILNPDTCVTTRVSLPLASSHQAFTDACLPPVFFVEERHVLLFAINCGWYGIQPPRAPVPSSRLTRASLPTVVYKESLPYGSPHCNPSFIKLQSCWRRVNVEKGNVLELHGWLVGQTVPFTGVDHML